MGGVGSVVSYHGNHAVVLLPGAAAAEEGDEEDDHAHSDQHDGGAGGRGVVDHEGFVQGDLNHDAHHDQRKSAQLWRGWGGGGRE